MCVLLENVQLHHCLSVCDATVVKPSKLSLSKTRCQWFKMSAATSDLSVCKWHCNRNYLYWVVSFYDVSSWDLWVGTCTQTDQIWYHNTCGERHVSTFMRDPYPKGAGPQHPKILGISNKC